jgi:hypothetical protein
MTTYYVGSDGNDGNTGTSWAQRKLTLNGVEDIPVTDNDLVWVGAGTYREQLTVDVSGAAEIEYRADTTGANTDGIGGVVRITGSDNDMTAARSYGIYGNGKNNRTFTGFVIDGCANFGIDMLGNNLTIQDCILTGCAYGMILRTGTNGAIQRVKALFNQTAGIAIGNAVAEDNTNTLIQNVDCLCNGLYGIHGLGKGSVTIKNVLLSGNSVGMREQTALTVGQTITINNSIITGNVTGLQATVLGEILEDYNNIALCTNLRLNVAVGAHSNAYLPQLDVGRLVEGRQYSVQLGKLASYSQLTSIAGTGEPADDLHGFTRASPSSWGSTQYEATRRAWDSGEPRGRRGV